MESLLDFILLRDPNVRYVVAGTVLVGASSALVGTFALLRKRALVGDAIAHSVLPGICLAFILHQFINPDGDARSLPVLLFGAFLSGWLSLWLIDVIRRNSRIKTDAAIGLVLSVFFGVGILLLTALQKYGSASQAGLDHFLFGKAAAILPSDVMVFAVVSALLLALVLFFYKEFKLISFDRAFSEASGLPVKWMEFLLASMTVMAVVIGIQAVGVVLMAALLITPAAAARFWTDRLNVMLVLATLFAALSSYVGSYVSYTNANMPTGPWIIVVVSMIAFLSMLFAPGRGMISKVVFRRNYRKKIMRENILKAIFKKGEGLGDFSEGMGLSELSTARAFQPGKLRSGIRSLVRTGHLQSTMQGAGIDMSTGIVEEQHFVLTPNGLQEGQRMARVHRLWELYLTQYLKIAPDHVHDDAEAVEHLITPEIEKQLEELLGRPEFDPHNKAIPYQRETGTTGTTTGTKKGGSDG